MANLKIDLLNKLSNDKYFKEMELARLSLHADMNYEIKIDQMSRLLGEIALLKGQIELLEEYFQEAPKSAPKQSEPKTEAPVPPAAPEVPKTHSGQTHGE